MSETRWLSATEAEAWRAYLDMGNGLEAAVARQLGAWGLSIPDYDVLARLTRGPGGPLRARELRESVGWDRSRLSHQLRRMEQRDLVRRSECVEDGRGTMIEITPAGRAAVEAAAPGHVRTVRHHLIDVATPAEIAMLRDLAGRVRARLNEPVDDDSTAGGP